MPVAGCKLTQERGAFVCESDADLFRLSVAAFKISHFFQILSAHVHLILPEMLCLFPFLVGSDVRHVFSRRVLKCSGVFVKYKGCWWVKIEN